MSLERIQVNSLTAHPTYGGPRMDAVPFPCPCCTSGSQHPSLHMCNPCHAKAVRLMVCVHEEQS